MTDQDAPDCRGEVEELHRFFESWFRGTVPATEAVFRRFSGALAPDFEIVSPDGRRTPRAELETRLRAAHAVYESDPSFRIWIDAVQVRRAAAGLWVVTYEEWQTIEAQDRARVSSAVFERGVGGMGVRWVYLQETWRE